MASGATISSLGTGAGTQVTVPGSTGRVPCGARNTTSCPTSRSPSANSRLENAEPPPNGG
jgi:hypothetical protein